MANKKAPKVDATTLEQESNETLIYRLLSERVGAVDPHHIFYAKQIQNGPKAGKYSCLIAGKKISPTQAGNLKSEAMLLTKGEIWKLFTETLRHEAQLRMFEKSKTTDDMFFGKALLHAIGIFETIVNSIQHAEVDNTKS